MVPNKIKAIILKNELDNDHFLWEKACLEFKEKIDYRIVDLTKNLWLEEIQKEPFDILLAKPGNLTSYFKQLYDERIYILSEILKYKVLPSLTEILIYENKRFLSFWLKANNIPHPETAIFYFKNEAFAFVKSASFPIVAKTNIGASGSGVKILKNKNEALKYIDEAFNISGAPKRWGPNLEKGSLIKRGLHYVFHVKEIRQKLTVYKNRKQDIQNNFVLFQKYIAHEFEWRVVKIGVSYFAHKKLKHGEKASGSLLKGYDNPPLELFDFVKTICDEFNFNSVSIDIFEPSTGKYLINEIQCIFGQSDPHQMLVENIPGRYIYKNENWLFEKGEFNRNESYNLRLKYIINDLS